MEKCVVVLGYNHPAIVAALREDGALLSLVNRPCLSAFPPLDLAERVSNSLLKVAPPGLNKVCTLMCGTCSNENAFKAAFIRYMVSLPVPHLCLTCASPVPHRHFTGSSFLL